MQIAADRSDLEELRQRPVGGRFDLAVAEWKKAMEFAADARDAAIRRLRELWEEGLASGEPVEMPDDWAEDIIRRGRERLAAERKAG